MAKKQVTTSEDILFESFKLTCIHERPDVEDYYSYGYDHRWWRSVSTDPQKYTANTKSYSKYSHSNNQISYYYEGVRHRLHGPAIINLEYDCEFWLKMNIFHRDDGPAYRHKRTLKWYVDGFLHRLDGPAVMPGGAPKEYWIGGQRMSPKNYKLEIERRKRKGLL